MVSKKQARIHQKKKRKKKRVRRKKLYSLFVENAVKGIGYTVVPTIILNFDSILSFIKELFLNISNSRYKMREN